MRKNLPATKVDSIVNSGETPGAFKFGRLPGADEPCGMHFICPCGCGRQGWLPFRPEPSPSWEWDGDEDKPTLKPSVLQVGGCRWHGWLRNGVWESC